MKRTSYRLRTLSTAAVFLLASSCLLRADVFYSGLQNIAVPTNFDGIYLNLDTGVTTAASAWDINAVFGGARVYNSDSFQPARVGTGNENPIIALPAGATVGSSLMYATGFGASDGHLGTGANQFQPGQEAYLGFSFKTDANSGPHYGWMRVVFTANEPGGLIKDWGYETGVTGAAPQSITTGNILQAAPAGGISVVTLTSGSGVASTLGSILSDIGAGIVTALTKLGAGKWTLSGEQTYTGATTLNDDSGTLEVGPSGGKLSGTASISINNTGTLLLSGTGGTDIKLNSAAPVALAGGTIDLSGMSSSLNQTVGSLTLSAASTSDRETLLAGDTLNFSGTSDDPAPVFREGGKIAFARASSTLTPTAGALTLSTSTLDFGTLLPGHTWHFGASNGDWSNVQLSIFNYTPGTDHLFFGSDTTALNTAQLDQILFYGDDGSILLGSAKWLGGTGEVAPVPEPGTWAAGLLSVGALAYLRRRRAGSRGRARPPGCP